MVKRFTQSVSNNKCGIYFLCIKGKIVYIGKTTDLANRLMQHKRQLMEYDAFRFIACQESKLDEYEVRWIKKFKPCFNTKHTTEKKKYYYYKPVMRSKPLKARIPMVNERIMKFRKLTEKSIIGFGRYKDTTVARILTSGKFTDLIMMYFRTSHITFFENILDELKITNEWRIEKPGTNKDLGDEFMAVVYPEELEKWRVKYHQKSINLLKSSKHASFNKKVLQMKNQGKF